MIGGSPIGTVPISSPPGDVVAAILTGTAVPTLTEGEIVAGAKTIVITLSGTTWIPE